MPNFRLFDTQARWSSYLATISGAGLLALTILVFRGANLAVGAIPFKPDSTGMGRYRLGLILITTALVALAGLFAAGMGYHSLGEKRNEHNTHSWVGMLLGALFTTCALLNLIAWKLMAVQVF